MINAETASPAARIVLEQLHASEALFSRRVAKSTLRARGAATGGRATHLGNMSSTVVPEVAVRAATPSLNPCRAGLFSPWPWPAPRTTRACACSCEPARYLQVAGSNTLERSACARFSTEMLEACSTALLTPWLLEARQGSSRRSFAETSTLRSKSSPASSLSARTLPHST